MTTEVTVKKAQPFTFRGSKGASPFHLKVNVFYT